MRAAGAAGRVPPPAQGAPHRSLLLTSPGALAACHGPLCAGTARSGSHFHICCPPPDTTPRLAPLENRVLATFVTGFQNLPRPGRPQTAVGQTLPPGLSLPPVQWAPSAWHPAAPSPRPSQVPAGRAPWRPGLGSLLRRGQASWLLEQGRLDSSHHKATTQGPAHRG